MFIEKNNCVRYNYLSLKGECDMADYYDFLGNKVNIGDLIVYPDSDGMPHTSHIEKLTDNVRKNASVTDRLHK